MGQYIEKIVWPSCWNQLRCLTMLSCPPRQRHRLPGGSKMTCGRPRPELRSRRDITTCHRSVRWWRHGHCIKHFTSLHVTYYIMSPLCTPTVDGGIHRHCIKYVTSFLRYVLQLVNTSAYGANRWWWHGHRIKYATWFRRNKYAAWLQCNEYVTWFRRNSVKCYNLS